MNLREWALPVYTVLTQMAIGMLLVLWILRSLGARKYGQETMNSITRDPLLIILTTVVLGMLGAQLHLSKPFLSFLAVRNIGSSWLSREIVLTVLFFLVMSSLCYLQWVRKGHWKLETILGWLGISFGLVDVFCMGRIYLLPAQAAWDTPETILSYYGTMLLLGVMAMASILILDLRFNEVRLKQDFPEWDSIVKETVRHLAVSAGLILIPVILINLAHIYSMMTGSPLEQTSYQLLMQLYEPLLIARYLVLLAGVGYLIYPVATMKRTGKTIQALISPAYLACLMVIIGEVIGRFLFYADHIRMGL